MIDILTGDDAIPESGQKEIIVLFNLDRFLNDKIKSLDTIEYLYDSKSFYILDNFKNCNSIFYKRQKPKLSEESYHELLDRSLKFIKAMIICQMILKDFPLQDERDQVSIFIYANGKLKNVSEKLIHHWVNSDRISDSDRETIKDSVKRLTERPLSELWFEYKMNLTIRSGYKGLVDRVVPTYKFRHTCREIIAFAAIMFLFSSLISIMGLMIYGLVKLILVL